MSNNIEKNNQIGQIEIMWNNVSINFAFGAYYMNRFLKIIHCLAIDCIRCSAGALLNRYTHVFCQLDQVTFTTNVT